MGASDLTIAQVLAEAWRLTKGFKFTALATLMVVVLIIQVATAVLGMVTVSPKDYAAEGDIMMQFFTSFWQGLALLPLSAPLYAGVAMLSVRRIQGHKPKLGSAFGYFSKMLPLTVAQLLFLVLTLAGFALLIIPGLFLLHCWIFVQLLVADRDLRPSEAIKLAINAVKGRFWHVAGTLFVAGCVLGLSVIPLGIGLIWSLPWLLLVNGVLYRSLFGVQSVPFLARASSDGASDIPLATS